MKYLYALFSLVLITSYASYSPEQLQTKASGKTVIQSCFDMILPNPNMSSKVLIKLFAIIRSNVYIFRKV